MTHPINEPRTCKRAEGEAPAPIAFEPEGGCMGVTGRIVKVLVGECLACARLPVGGVQIAPDYVRKGCGIDCKDVVHGDLTVRPLHAPGQSAFVGGNPLEGNVRQRTDDRSKQR